MRVVTSDTVVVSGRLQNESRINGAKKFIPDEERHGEEVEIKGRTRHSLPF